MLRPFVEDENRKAEPSTVIIKFSCEEKNLYGKSVILWDIWLYAFMLFSDSFIVVLSLY